MSFRSSLLAVLLLDASLLGAYAAWTHPGPGDLGRFAFMGAISLPFAVVALTQPSLRRLALASHRRRWRSGLALLAAGSLAACVTTTTRAVADALHRSPDAMVRDHLGPVDELIISQSARDRITAQEVVTKAIASDLTLSAPNPLDRLIDGQLALTSLPVRVQPAVRARRKASPHAVAARDATAIELDVAAAQQFGRDRTATGLERAAPIAAGHALIGRDLASDLGLRRNDTFGMQIGGRATLLTVDRVLPRRGIAALSIDATTRPRVLFVAPGSLTTAVGAGDAQPSYLLAISNTGGTERGVDLSGVVTGRLDGLFEAKVAGSDGAPSAAIASTVFAVKRQLLDVEGRTTGRARSLFASLGSAAAIAALVLFLRVGQSFVRSRRGELASMRVLGMRKLDSVAALGLEGWIGAAAMTAAGTVGGVVLGAVLGRAAAASASVPGGGVLAVELGRHSIVESAALTFGALIAALMSALTWLAWRPAIDLLRGASVGRRRSRPHLWSVMLAIVFALLGASVSGRSAALVVALPPLAAFGLLVLLSRLGRTIPSRIVALVASAGVVWSLGGRLVWPSLLRRADERAFFAAALTGVACAAVAMTALGHPLRRLLPPFVPARTLLRRLRRGAGDAPSAARRAAAGASTARRVALKGLRSESWRSGLTLSSVAAVVLTLTATSVVSATSARSVAGDVRDAAGGWDLTAVDVASLRASGGPAEGIAALATFSTAEVDASAPGNETSSALVAYGFDDAYVKGGAARLARRTKGIASDGQAWRTVLRDPKSVIVDPARVPSKPNGSTLRPGDELFLRDLGSGRSLTLVVTATMRSSAGLAPVMLGARALEGMARDVTGPTPAVARLERSSSTRWHGAAASGVRTFRQAVADQELPTIQITRVLRRFLLLAALLSLLCLGALAAADLRTRAPSLAALRTIGLRQRDVRRLVLTEGHVLFAEGTLVGVVLGAFAGVWLVDRGLVSSHAGTSLPGISLVPIVAIGWAGVAALTWLLNRRTFAPTLPVVASR